MNRRIREVRKLIKLLTYDEMMELAAALRDRLDPHCEAHFFADAVNDFADNHE